MYNETSYIMESIYISHELFEENYNNKKFVVSGLNLRDGRESIIIDLYATSFNKFHIKNEENGVNSIICSSRGLRKAPTVVMAWMIKYRNYTLDDAMKYMYECRPGMDLCIITHLGLMDFEKMIKNL